MDSHCLLGSHFSFVDRNFNLWADGNSILWCFPECLGGFFLESRFSCNIGEWIGKLPCFDRGDKQLDISWTSGEITLIPYEGEDVYFTETSDTPLNEKNSLRYGVSDGVLVIRFQEKGSLFGRQPRQKTAGYDSAEFGFRSARGSGRCRFCKYSHRKIRGGKITCTATSGGGCTYGTAGRQNRDRDGIW